MPRIKSWKSGSAGEPSFAADFDIIRHAVLQNTDIRTNRNKYYAIELHHGKAKADYPYRVFTHYGRTDDLERNPNAGVREGRYFATLGEAEATYQQIYRQKTSARKGYREVNLASSRIGSQQARGASSGHVDDATLQKMNADRASKPKPKRRVSTLSKPVQHLVSYLYDEATHTLTSTVNAKITANGIETPLGVLTLGQVESGQSILDEALKVYHSRQRNKTSRLADLSGDFYTAIPHRIGRSRSAMQAAVLNSEAAFEQKQQTLQLMRDMLKVSGDGEQSVLFDPEIDRRYEALGAELKHLSSRSDEHGKIVTLMQRSLRKMRKLNIQNIYTLRRPGERSVFDKRVGNERLLMHGSRIHNWVGILSRGLLLPRVVVQLGVKRTDGGWLGHGLYFGDAACTSYYYTSPGRKGTRFIALARVALGKMKPYRKITYGLTAPPKGFDSCHGVRGSQFADDEYVIYRGEQQQLEYLVEIR